MGEFEPVIPHQRDSSGGPRIFENGGLKLRVYQGFGMAMLIISDGASCFWGVRFPLWGSFLICLTKNILYFKTFFKTDGFKLYI